MLMLLLPLNQYEQSLLIVFTLLVHEAAFFIIVPVIIFIFPANDRIRNFFIIAIYLFTLLLGKNFELMNIISIQTSIGDVSSFQYAVANPFLTMFEIIISYKLLWLLFPISYKLLKEKRKVVIISTMIALSSILMIFIAVDISRMMGWGFIGFLFIVKLLIHNSDSWSANRITKHVIFSMVIINIFLPSLYIGANTGIVMMKGLYSFMIQGLTSLLTNGI
jgi:hypothetical protein